MEDNRTAFYRQIHGGVLIYDSRARNPCENEACTKVPKVVLTPEIKKDIDKCDPFGK